MIRCPIYLRQVLEIRSGNANGRGFARSSAVDVILPHYGRAVVGAPVDNSLAEYLTRWIVSSIQGARATQSIVTLRIVHDARLHFATAGHSGSVKSFWYFRKTPNINS
jgi:hypothetical protein